MGLVSATTGSNVAEYAYGPFGEPLKVTGPAAEANPYRFSAKYADGETGLLYYGYRYYQPQTGRWIVRDPAGRRGGVNLYSFVRNAPSLSTDLMGLLTYDQIVAGDACYSCNCGWLDSTHYNEFAAGHILSQMHNYPGGTGSDTVLVTIEQGPLFGSSGPLSGINATYILHYDASGITPKQFIEIGLGIYMDAQNLFEAFQGTILGGDWWSHSSFSVEDLPSDFIGFLIKAGVFTEVEMKTKCKALDVGPSEHVFCHGKGDKKNHSYKPKFWSPKVTGDPDWPCPTPPSIPSFFDDYKPAASSTDTWVRESWGSFWWWVP